MAENQPVGRQVQAPAAVPAAPAPATVLSPAQASAPTTGGPVAASHYRDGKLTREGMEHIVRGGGSVIHGGRVLNSLAHLPSEAELAKGDDVAEAAALDNINRQRAQLDAQEATLKANKKK